MKNYSVSVQVVKTLKDPLKIWADDEEGARIKAEAIVLAWEGIDEAQAYDVQEVQK